jgi:hypothetical protein
MNISETIQRRLAKDRPMTSITLRIPVDVVDSMKAIAPLRGMAGYQSLLKFYVSEGLRRDEADFSTHSPAVVRLMEALSRRGVSQSLLEEAAREFHMPG